jgi:uncharacterized protein YecE (DUF72 family)
MASVGSQTEDQGVGQPAETGSIFVGTSGWAYPAWKPLFFPEKLAQKKFLSYYATRLNAVEVNYSFRHFISEKTLENWVADTPPGFAFCIKAHQAITHIRRLKDTEEILRRFLDSVQPLAAARKLGAILFQLPPNLKADATRLQTFLNQLPHSGTEGFVVPAFRAAFEFRHPSWFEEPILTLLRQHNVALCMAESENLSAPDVATASFSYYRFRRPDYLVNERLAIAGRLLNQAANDRAVFGFFKHEERPESALWAEEVLQLARKNLP